MSNPFDQFDAPKANPFDQFDADTPQPQQPQQPPPRTLGQEATRQGKLFVRALANVAASPVAIGGDALNKGVNALLGTRLAMPSETIERGLDAFLPKPETGVERFTQEVAKSAPAFALPASLPAQAVGNAAIAAAQAAPGEEGSQAAIGAATGAAGQVLARTVGGLVRPTREAQELMGRGVALTPGQAAGVGSLPNRIEQWAASNPVASHVVRGAQRRGVEEANRAAAESVAGIVEHGKKLGLPAREAIEQTRELIGRHYDEALSGMSVPLRDASGILNGNLEDIVRGNPMMPPQALDQMRRYLASRINWMAENGVTHLDGPMLKQLDAEVGGQIRRLQSSTNAADKTAAPAWRDLQQALRDVMEAGAGSPEQVAQLSQANAAYRQLLALEKAMLPGSETFTPRRIVATLEKMGIKGTDLNRVAEAMSKTLPNTVPDSGTAERLLANALPTLLLGGGYGANELGYGTVGSGLMAAGALGSRPGTRFLTGNLAGQTALANALRRATPAALRAANTPPSGGE